MNVVDFNMIQEMNLLLKDRGIEYTIHLNGGCSNCGMKLIQVGKEYAKDVIISLINDYLNEYWLKASFINDEDIIVESKSK